MFVKIENLAGRVLMIERLSLEEKRRAISVHFIGSERYIYVCVTFLERRLLH